MENTTPSQQPATLPPPPVLPPPPTVVLPMTEVVTTTVSADASLSPVVPPAKPPGTYPRTFALLVLIIIIMVGLLYYFLPKSSVLKGGQTVTQTETETETLPTEAITVDASPMTESVICSSQEMSLLVALPDSSWSCGAQTAETMTASSDKFNLTISTLGRDEYCSVPDTDPTSPRYNADPNTCVITDFLSNGMLDTKLYTSLGIDKEIYGSLVNNGPSVSISFNGTDTTFTDADKAMIKTMLNSVAYRTSNQ